jgi:putative transposase
MRENDIKVIRTQKYKGDDGHQPRVHHCAQSAGPIQKWAGHKSYIWPQRGLILSGRHPSSSLRVIGWAVSNRMKQDLAIRGADTHRWLAKALWHSNERPHK